MKKRSVDQLDAVDGEVGIQFAEFAGKNIVHFIILGADEDETSQQWGAGGNTAKDAGGLKWMFM